MSTRSKIIFAVLIIIIVLIGLFWFLRIKTAVVPAEKSAGGGIEEKTEKFDEEVIIPAIDEETKIKLELQKKASMFVERYGSYSNQSDYENIIDLKPFMTKAMRVSSDNFVKKERAKQSDKESYRGYFAKALNSAIEIFSEQQTTVKVYCQRTEIIGDPSNSKTYYQFAKINFLKESGEWKVAEIKWE